MEKEQTNMLFIPRGIKSEKEIFSNITKKGLIRIIFGVLMSLAICSVVIIFKSTSTTFLIFFILTFVNVLANINDKNLNVSIVDQINTIYKYYKRQKIYLYKKMTSFHV